MNRGNLRAKGEMLIRRPISEVYEAFVNPEITTKFWFTKSSGRLEEGKWVEWTWDMYDVSVRVRVKEAETNRRILIEWGNPGELTEVEWTFTPVTDDTTFVSITNFGFQGSDDEIVTKALDSMGGFMIVLAGAKAWLEHNIKLNLVADRFPEGLRRHETEKIKR